MQDLTIRYGYAVQDDEGNDFNQQEQSDGEQVTSSNKYKQINKQTNKQISTGIKQTNKQNQQAQSDGEQVTNSGKYKQTNKKHRYQTNKQTKPVGAG